MKKRHVFLFALLFVLIFFHTSLMAEFSFQVDLASRYIWRGFDLNPYKKPVIQPFINYKLGNSGLSLNLWTCFSFENKEVNEIDFTVTYALKTIKNFSLKTGLIHYGWYFVDNFRFKDDTSHELFVSAGLPNVFLNPSITVYYDFTNGDGFYILLETEYSLNSLESIGADFSASLGYNGGQWLADGVDPGFSDLNLGITLPFKIDNFQISPFANCTIVLLDAIGKENHFWYGISVSYKQGKD